MPTRSNNYHLQGGRLVAGKPRVNSLARVRAFNASEAGKIGRVQFPASAQRIDNKRRGIDAYKEFPRGLWGK